jgi:hypothetical protein
MHRRGSKFATKECFPPQRRANLRCNWARAASLAMVIRVVAPTPRGSPRLSGTMACPIQRCYREGGQLWRTCSH